MEYFSEAMSGDGERPPVALRKESCLLLQSLPELASFFCLVVLSPREVRRLISVSIPRR